MIGWRQTPCTGTPCRRAAFTSAATSRTWVDFPYCIACGNGGAHQLSLQFPGAILQSGIELDPARFASRPGQERQFVDRRVDRACRTVDSQMAGDRAGVTCKPVDEVRRKYIEVIRPAEVAKRPDDL